MILRDYNKNSSNKSPQKIINWTSSKFKIKEYHQQSEKITHRRKYLHIIYVIHDTRFIHKFFKSLIPVHQPRAPCIMHRTWTGDSFHMIIYMIQCHPPISSHPCPLPQSPKDCSIHLCLSCCLAHRVIVTIFLNSIYMH